MILIKLENTITSLLIKYLYFLIENNKCREEILKNKVIIMGSMLFLNSNLTWNWCKPFHVALNRWWAIENDLDKVGKYNK